MTNPARLQAWTLCLLLLATVMTMPVASHAQAWLPDPGTGAIYVGYQYSHAHWTLFPIDITGYHFCSYIGEGKRVYKGEHYGQFVTVDLDYGIRKGLAMTVHVPYIASKYAGLCPHYPNGVDDGTYQGTFQDLGVGLHQTVLSKPFVATPFVRYIYPLQSYGADGHAAAGQHMRALEVGAALARTLWPYLPDAYGQVTYTYTAAERVFDHTMHINRVDMELGYFLTPRLSLKGAATWGRASGGVEWDGGAELIEYQAHHDRLANQRAWRVGGGTGYALSPRVVLYIYVDSTISGENTHKLTTVATGVGWNFAMPWVHKNR